MTTDTELFSIAPSPSPKILWMRANHITTYEIDIEAPEDGWPMECPETGNDIWLWQAERMPHDREGGLTEVEALQKIAMKLGIPLWNQ